MKTFSTGRLATLSSGQTNDAWFARVVRTDGVTIGMTSHDQDITISAVTYQSGSGYDPSAVGANIQFTPGVVDVEGILSTLGVDRADIAAGLYDNARLYVFITDYTNPIVDEIKTMTGYWSDVRLMRGRFMATFRSLIDLLQQNVGRTAKPACDAELGDSRCQTRLNPDAWQASTAVTVRESRAAETGTVVTPTSENGYFFECSTAGTTATGEPTWNTTSGATTSDGTAVWTARRAYTLTGSITGVVSDTQFVDSSRNEPANWWRAGKITFGSGNNDGFSMEIKTSTATGVITIHDAMPYPFATGDSYTVQTGCLKRHIEDCKNIYRNGKNFQGQPHKPTSNEVTKYGGQ